jgi:uncharacterized membrane protein
MPGSVKGYGMEKLKDLFKSKLFWAAIVGLALIVVGALFPGVVDSADPDQVTAAVLLIVAYIVGSAIDPSIVPDLRPIKDKIKQLFQSRKFWAALVGTAVVIIKQLKPDFPLDEEQITQIVWLLASYILGVGIADRAKETSFV